MPVITITISIDVPAGATVAVQGAPEAPRSLPAPERQQEEFPPFPGTPGGAPIELWPEGQCPKHLRPWKSGNYGLFCSAKDESQNKGYCILKPGDIYEGKRAA